MERRAQLFLQSRQHLDGVSERFSQHWEGFLSDTAEGIVLKYQEESGKASLRFAGDTVELRRPGTRLLFRAGETSQGQYATPYGTLTLALRTDYLRHSVTMSGGKALLRYELLSGGGSLGTFALTIQITVPEAESPPSSDSNL
jgi:uncharacterized beta-barrel protein YwiB (DUF1934 family)